MLSAETSAQLTALEEERAFADRSGYRKILVSGSEAGGWLHDLLTARIAGLAEGRATRSLLLTPTGRIRADVTVARTEQGWWLLQDPRQPTSIDDLLAPYVLSSDVAMTDRSSDLLLIAVPGAGSERMGMAGTRPSVLGEGEDLLAPTDAGARLESMLVRKQLVEVGDEALEIWRIRRGLARFPVDLDEDSLPAEAELDALIDATKGCFLGQESVAKVRNLGHPTRVVRAALGPPGLEVGTAVVAGDETVGVVTSAAPDPTGATACLVRVTWAAAGVALSTPQGTALRRGPRPDGGPRPGGRGATTA